MTVFDQDPSGLSTRGRRLASEPPTAEYLHAHWERSSDPFHPEHQPAGYIALCVAENRLVEELLSARLEAARPPAPRVLHYDTMRGSERFRDSIARFMESTFVGRPVDPDHIAVMAGAGAVLESVFYSICDPGDGVLIPTPSYSGFWVDLETRANVRIVPVHTRAADGFALTEDLLDDAMERADVPVRALLFTSPDNPIGRVYTREELDHVSAWSRKHGLHLVADEIYALSAYGARRFTSVADGRSLDDDIHVVWGFSKDFGASGLRAGVLLSENRDLIGSIDTLAYWSATSGHTQDLLAQVIDDRSWTAGFLDTLQARLRSAHASVVGKLAEFGITTVPADAGIFVLCDMRPFMDALTWDAEARLWNRILAEANVNLTPGSACHIGEPGFMRLCFASQPTEAVLAAIGRIGSVLR